MDTQLLPQQEKVFINCDKPNESFILNINEKELNILTLKQIISMAEQFKKIKFSSWKFECGSTREDTIANHSPLKFSPVFFHDISFNDEIGQIIIKPLTGKTLNLDTNINATVYQAKLMIEDQLDIPPNQQTLTYLGNKCEDNNYLRYYDIQRYSTIYLILRLSGGGRGGDEGKQFVDLENKDEQQQIKFSNEGPDWRVAKSGANVEGYCRNSKCEFFNKLVISPQGFGAFELIPDFFDQIVCPHPKCKNPIEIVTCGFTDCLFKWQGIKKVDGKLKMINSSFDKADSRYTRHNIQKSDGSSNVVTWKELFICSKPLKKECQICHNLLPNFVNFSDVFVQSMKECKDPQYHKYHERCVKATEFLNKGFCMLCKQCDQI